MITKQQNLEVVAAAQFWKIGVKVVVVVDRDEKGEKWMDIKKGRQAGEKWLFGKICAPIFRFRSLYFWVSNWVISLPGCPKRSW